MELAGEAMDTLKMKIGLLKSENKEAAEKMALAEKVNNEELIQRDNCCMAKLIIIKCMET